MTKRTKVLIGVAVVVVLAIIGGVAGSSGNTDQTASESTLSLLGTGDVSPTTVADRAMTTVLKSTSTTLTATTAAKATTTTAKATTTTEASTTTSGASTTTAKVTTTTGLGADGELTVYITDTGKKYHRDGCRNLDESKHAISLAEARRAGYEPCKVCEPPR